MEKSILAATSDLRIKSKGTPRFGPPAPSMAQQNTQIQEYWLPGFMLSRHIVLGQLQYFLGPTARVRPFSYQGRDGYLIVGMQLTRVRMTPGPSRSVSDNQKGQIDDLQSLSREYERQETIRMSRSSGQRDAYINEPIPVARRSSPDYGSYRNSR